MKTTYKVYWDNGGHACGTMPESYATWEEAEKAAAQLEAENRANDVWDQDGFAEAIEVEEPDEGDGFDEMGELRKAALNRGQP